MREVANPLRIALVDGRRPVPAILHAGGVGREGILPTGSSDVFRMSCARRTISGAPIFHKTDPAELSRCLAGAVDQAF